MAGGPGDICSACGDVYQSHFAPDGTRLTQHQFTLTPGDLRPQPPPQPPRAPVPGDAHPTFGRLVEILVDREILSLEDVLYIAGVTPHIPGTTHIPGAKSD